MLHNALLQVTGGTVTDLNSAYASTAPDTKGQRTKIEVKPCIMLLTETKITEPEQEDAEHLSS